jgi:hypothetical protein
LEERTFVKMGYLEVFPVTSISAFLHGLLAPVWQYRGQNSGLCARQACALLLEPHLQPSGSNFT